MTMRIIGSGPGTLVLAIALLAAAPAALASDHNMNIPALAFVPAADAVVGERNSGSDGTFAYAEGKFYAAVQFPKLANRSVCEFRLFVRDFDDGLDATARLLRKGTGAASTFSDAVVMAEVSSSGGSQDMQSFSTSTISSAAISGNYFYFVELELPANNNMQVLGVRVTHKDVC